MVLSVNRSLWGKVSPALRAVCARELDRLILIRFYFETEPDDDEKEDMSVAVTEVISDYLDHEVRENWKVIPLGERVRVEEGWSLIFLRKEYERDQSGRKRNWFNFLQKRA